MTAIGDKTERVILYNQVHLNEAGAFTPRQAVWLAQGMTWASSRMLRGDELNRESHVVAEYTHEFKMNYHPMLKAMTPSWRVAMITALVSVGTFTVDTSLFFPSPSPLPFLGLNVEPFSDTYQTGDNNNGFIAGEDILFNRTNEAGPRTIVRPLSLNLGFDDLWYFQLSPFPYTYPGTQPSVYSDGDTVEIMRPTLRKFGVLHVINVDEANKEFEVLAKQTLTDMEGFVPTL